MNGHVIDALRSLLLYDFEVNLGREIFNALYATDRFVDGNCAYRNRRMAQNSFTNFANIPTCAEVHYGIGSEMHSRVQLLELFVNIRSHRGVADIRIDLA